jgi:hypothetical protein
MLHLVDDIGVGAFLLYDTRRDVLLLVICPRNVGIGRLSIPVSGWSCAIIRTSTKRRLASMPTTSGLQSSPARIRIACSV